MTKLDRWDALVRDYKITFAFDEDHVTDKVRHAAVHAMAPGAVEENRLARRRDLNTYKNFPTMIDVMIRDKRETRGAIKLGGGGDPLPPDVDQLKLREVASKPTGDASEKESEPQFLQELGRLFEPSSADAKNAQGHGQRQWQKWKAKSMGKSLTCNVCGGVGLPARLRPSEGWVNTLDEGQ